MIKLKSSNKKHSEYLLEHNLALPLENRIYSISKQKQESLSSFEMGWILGERNRIKIWFLTFVVFKSRFSKPKAQVLRSKLAPSKEDINDNFWSLLKITSFSFPQALKQKFKSLKITFESKLLRACFLMTVLLYSEMKEIANFWGLFLSKSFIAWELWFLRLKNFLLEKNQLFSIIYSNFYLFFDFNAPCLCKTEMNFQFWCSKNHQDTFRRKGLT